MTRRALRIVDDIRFIVALDAVTKDDIQVDEDALYKDYGEFVKSIVVESVAVGFTALGKSSEYVAEDDGEQLTHWLVGDSERTFIHAVGIIDK